MCRQLRMLNRDSRQAPPRPSLHVDSLGNCKQFRNIRPRLSIQLPTSLSACCDHLPCVLDRWLAAFDTTTGTAGEFRVGQAGINEAGILIYSDAQRRVRGAAAYDGGELSVVIYVVICVLE